MEPKPQISSFSADSGQSYVEKEGKCAFTPAQLHEFHQQSLILKYIVAGLPVPFYLIVPIWKSIARSFGSANGGVYNQYPSLIGFSPLRFDYRAIMDPEPGRCRRTDGKKWRCSKNVVPDQKYCERHMHRGRNRSRKHVEASLHISDSETALNSKNGTTKIDSSDSTKIKGDTSISVPLNLELATSTTTRSDMSISVPLNLVLATPSSNAIGSGGIAKNDNTNSETRNLKSVPAAINNTYSSINSEYIDGKRASYNQFVNQVNNEDNLCRLNNFKSGSGGFMVQGFRFSPKSVLEGGYKSSLVYNSEETELHRCRRTDGKKWRCNKTIVPDQKYCIRHLHRGAKKMDISSQSVTVAVANAGPTHISSVQSPPLGIPKKENDHTNLDTNLSISIGARPQEMEADTSTSDATTITDENGSISHLLASSP